MWYPYVIASQTALFWDCPCWIKKPVIFFKIPNLNIYLSKQEPQLMRVSSTSYTIDLQKQKSFLRMSSDYWGEYGRGGTGQGTFACFWQYTVCIDWLYFFDWFWCSWVVWVSVENNNRFLLGYSSKRCSSKSSKCTNSLYSCVIAIRLRDCMNNE